MADVARSLPRERWAQLPADLVMEIAGAGLFYSNRGLRFAMETGST
jgi:hypothetical protein